MKSLSIGTHVENLINEYQSIVSELDSPDDTDALGSRLVSQSEWTAKGAQTIIHLAHQYGSFVLANALALADALEIEDGECGI